MSDKISRLVSDARRASETREKLIKYLIRHDVYSDALADAWVTLREIDRLIDRMIQDSLDRTAIERPELL